MIVEKTNKRHEQCMYKCDKCGIRTPDIVTLHKRDVLRDKYPLKDFDLCISCYKMLKRSIDKPKKSDNLETIKS